MKPPGRLAKLYSLFRFGKHSMEQNSSRDQLLSRDQSDSTDQIFSRDQSDSTDQRGLRDQNDARDGQHIQVKDPATKPWSAVCYLESTFDHGRPTNGTGFLIDETIVVTAAHNLCTLKNGQINTPHKILIKLGNKEYPLMRSPARSDYDTKFAREYADCLQQMEQGQKTIPPQATAELEEIASYHDYGAILLRKPITPTFLFPVRGAEPNDSCWDQKLTSAGYFRHPDDPLRRFNLYYGTGAACSDDRFDGKQRNLVRTTVRVEKGQSGGPLFVLEGGLVVGIQVQVNPREQGSIRTYGAVRITEDMVRLFKAWNDEYRRSIEFGRGQDDVSA